MRAFIFAATTTLGLALAGSAMASAVGDAAAQQQNQNLYHQSAYVQAPADQSGATGSAAQPANADL